MEPLFKVVALGTQASYDPDIVRANLRRILIGEPASVEAAIQRILVQESTLIATDLTHDQARTYEQRCAEAGLICTVSPMVLALDTSEVSPRLCYCPACGHQQPENAHGPNRCERCGNVYRVPPPPPETGWRAGPHPPASVTPRTSRPVAEPRTIRSSAGPRTTPSPTEPRTIRSPEPTRPNFEPPPPPIVQDIPRQRQSRPMAALGLGLGLALITLVAGLLLWDRLATRQDVVQPLVQVAEKPPSPAPAKPVADIAISPPVLVNLALYHLAAGDLTAVEAELQRVNAMLGSLKPQNLPIETLDTLNHLRVDLLAGLASQGNPQPASAREHWGRAVTIINFIVAPSERAQALSGLARSLRGRDPASAETHFNSAIATARNTLDPATRVLALSAVARDLAEADRLKQADELFRQAMETAESMTESNPQLTALGAIAKYRAETGDSALAQILLDRIATALTGSRAWPSPALLPDQLAEYGLEAQGALARNLALDGNEAEARTEFAASIEQAATLKDPERRARVNLYLARCLVEMGKRDQAAHLVAAVTQELKTRRPPD